MSEVSTSVLLKPILFETALGQFRFQASFRPESPDVTEAILVERKPSQELPDGMKVERCRAIILRIEGTTPIHRVTFRCSLENNAVPGFPCTGQGLEAQEWENLGHLVVVGTEDGEWLNARLPFLDCEDQAIVSYTPNSMTLELNNVPASQKMSLHFVLAENSYPEPVDCSAWFAVDCPHVLLI